MKQHFLPPWKLLTSVLVLLVSAFLHAQNKVVAYVPNWINLNSYASTIDYSKLTHINIAFENLYNDNGDLSFNSADNTLIAAAHARGVKVCVSIGGGAASGDQVLTNRYFTQINSANRVNFVNKIAAYVTAHNFDGIDVDLEGPSINGDYGAFIQVLSDKLRPMGKLVTAALSQGYGGDKVSTATVQYFDFVNIMAYDGRGYWDPNNPGQHSSLDFAKSNTQYWLNRGLPRAKAVLGVPFYGYGFGSAFRNRDYSYKEIIAAYPGAENVDQVGSTIWYNGIPTIKAKTNYAFDMAIGGIMIWSLDYDGTGAKSLLTAIDEVFDVRSVPTVPQGPYNNIRAVVPGKIEAENYDVGGSGVAYNDASAANEGGVFRADMVDIQATTDGGSGYNVGWTADGEWLEYSIDVTSSGTYDIVFRTAGIAAAAVRLELDGNDITGAVTLPNTGGWQTWANTTKTNVTLTAGQHVLRLVTVTGGYNLNHLTFSPVPQSPFAGTPIVLPGKLEAENYDLGGQGSSYNDASATNQGGVYRNDAVDIEATTDGGAGYNLGFIADGEWLEYTVNVAATANYEVTFRSAGNGGVIRMELDGADLSGNVALPNTGGWQTWETTVKGGVSLSAGQHVLRLFVVTGGFNLNYISVAPSQAPYSGTPISLPGKLEAENYDLGGQGTAFNDATATNEGGAYRNDGVDIQATTDAGTGFNVGYTAAGEWLEYTVNVTASGNYDVSFRTAGTSAGAIRMEVDGTDITGNVALSSTGGWQTWASTVKTNVPLSSGNHVVRLVVVTAGFNLNSVTVSPVIEQKPYNNIPIALPGKIEAENYDQGGQGIAYNDASTTNEGGSYRADAVDIESTTDAGGGYNVGYLATGEWLEYTVNVTTTGNYDVTFRTAGTAAGAIRMELDGSDVTGNITLPNTTGWQTWANTVKTNVPLSSGNHLIRLVVVTAGFNLNSVTITPVVVQKPYNNVAVNLPGKIEAENYDQGGQGIAYNDASTANEGGAYRTDGVDIETSTDVNGGYNLGYTADGEWLEYTVNVTTTGTYNVLFRTASTSGGTIRMEVDGADATGVVALPNTGGWQTWSTTTRTNVALTAGTHVIRLTIVTGGFNLNHISIAVPEVGPGFLRASGINIVNNAGNFQIRAINVGNWMVQEGYMLNLGGGYQWNIKNKIAEVVGTASRDKFYDDYLANYVTKRDVDSIAKWGFNSIRVPMHYNLFTPLGQQDVYLDKGFTMIDNLLAWCKANKLYLILDLHAAPGGQSSGDISDYVAGQPSLWESEANRQQTIKLWRKLAERYVNEEYIGGYDLINETNWTLPNNNALLAQLMKDITAAIRQVDNNHLLFIEGNSYANDYNGLTPKWDNNMAYSFHKYWNDNVDGSLNFAFAVRDAQNVPIWLGEFGENSNHWIAEAVSLMNKYNIGWAIWPYKKMGSVSGTSSFKEPANWGALASYINGGAKPSAAVGQAILDEMIQNIKVENCTVNYGYLRALLTQPGNNSTAPFKSVTLPGTILAAQYDQGKNGYAYSDAIFQTTQFGSGGGSYTAWNTGWYYRNDGVDVQLAASENGPVVGWTETNEWMNYTVNISASAIYSVQARVAGNGGRISISVDGTTLLNSVVVPATGSWTTYQNVDLGTLNLPSGRHTIRITIAAAGYNLSSLTFNSNAASTARLFGSEEEAATQEALVSNAPNPCQGNTTLNVVVKSGGEVSLKIYDLNGYEMATIKEGYLEAGNYSFEYNVSGLKSNVYLVKFVTESGTAVHKLMVNE